MPARAHFVALSSCSAKAQHAWAPDGGRPSPPPAHTPPQLEPKDLAEQLKRGGAAVPAIRPGKQTAEYVTNTLTRMSLLGSVFLGGSAAGRGRSWQGGCGSAGGGRFCLGSR